MNILFRADSSSTIGTGHIMRDLVLAKQYERSDIVFATQNLDGNINNKREENGYKLVELKSNDIKEILTLIQKYSIDMIIIDHYSIDYDFEKKLKESNPHLIIFVFDDTYEKHHCDILLNMNIYANANKYKNLVPNYCDLRCGFQYLLVRDEFVIEREKGRQNNNDKVNLNIFIAMGGADHSNINIGILQVLKDFSNIHVHAVTTLANKYLEALKNYVEHSENITLHVNTNKIAKLMNEADFAIITPSVTMNEIFYLDIPFIAIKTADNQRYMYEYL
ncbi:MAG TPA: UDP-2,4-diacetamido-2,4,6-trideoxy-beta-L-altropyranose hydrolase, partial [Saprospiraceae bacterium]|nr:UDP-2,4-diacetamido-2,4,6-trideoxy-beta-L-altropyranose hydrolase [Saprospiraceae bacterium]